MTPVSAIMTTNVQTIGPEQSLQAAAQFMDQLNVGSLPVYDGKRLLGMVTDRDITVRGTAAGLAPKTACVSDGMTGPAVWCSQDQDIEQIMRMMGEAQVRRVPVLDEHKELVGIVSLGDLATRQSGHIDRAVRLMSSPSEPDGGPANA